MNIVQQQAGGGGGGAGAPQQGGQGGSTQQAPAPPAAGMSDIPLDGDTQTISKSFCQFSCLSVRFCLSLPLHCLSACLPI